MLVKKLGCKPIRIWINNNQNIHIKVHFHIELFTGIQFLLEIPKIIPHHTLKKMHKNIQQQNNISIPINGNTEIKTTHSHNSPQKNKVIGKSKNVIKLHIII
jgi:uncharacterized ubiquitin-like protein YukD